MNIFPPNSNWFNVHACSPPEPFLFGEKSCHVPEAFLCMQRGKQTFEVRLLYCSI
uniref:Uncharacterized protein n=1 Tax=Anguilla anguilla TaxID=7936 RepID=A0A0E9X5C9_ANGAN